MTNLENIEVDTSDISFPHTTHIVFIMKSGARIGIATPLSASDFMKIWDTKKGRIKIVTGKDSFACIVKRNVDFFRIFPAINNQ